LIDQQPARPGHRIDTEYHYSSVVNLWEEVRGRVFALDRRWASVEGFTAMEWVQMDPFRPVRRCLPPGAVSDIHCGSGAPLWAPPDPPSPAYIVAMKRSIDAATRHGLDDCFEAAGSRVPRDRLRAVAT
jgi:hypothetical protein